MYTCADCAIHACDQENHEHLPKDCPIRNREVTEASFAVYDQEEFHKFYLISA